MALHIDVRDAGGITVLDLRGRLTIGEESQLYNRQIRQLVADNVASILVSLEELAYIDSCGVGELISGFTSVKKNGGTLKLVCPAGHVLQVLHLVRLPTIIGVYDTEEEALASFS
jgi:anti-sigma B factor antagonist